MQKKLIFFRKTFSIRLWQDSFLEFLRRREKNQGKLQKKISELCFIVILSQFVEQTSK